MWNNFKTMVLLTVLTLLFIWIGRLIGGRNGMVMAFVFAVVMNIFSYWFSDKIVLMMYRAQPVTEGEAPGLYKVVRGLAEQFAIPMPRLYMIPTETPNAFATGRSPQHAVVAVTQGILNLLEDEELEGVLAHELGHVRNRDILISSIVATVAGAIYMLADMARWASFFGGYGGERDRERGSGALQLAVLLLVAILAPIAATLIQLAISRSREYEADETGAVISHKPLALANALRKLQHGVQIRPMAGVSPTTAHLFIVNPLSAGSIANLFSTHPPIEERIKRLEGLAQTLI